MIKGILNSLSIFNKGLSKHYIFPVKITSFLFILITSFFLFHGHAKASYTYNYGCYGLADQGSYYTEWCYANTRNNNGGGNINDSSGMTVSVPSDVGNITIGYIEATDTGFFYGPGFSLSAYRCNGSGAACGINGNWPVAASSDFGITIQRIGPNGWADARMMFYLYKVPPPTISCSAGQGVGVGGGYLSWSTSSTVNVAIYGVGTYGTSGQVFVNPGSNTQYTFDAWNSKGVHRYCYATLIYAPPAVSLSPSAAYVDLGQQIALYYSYANATSISVTDVGSFGVGGNGSSYAMVSPVGYPKVYYMYGYGPGGSASTYIYVYTNPPVFLSFYASPTNVDLGGVSTLTWQTKNATSVAFSTGGVSPIISAGQALSGSYRYTPQASTTNITITATGPGGTVQSSTVTIRINPPTIISFSASPTSVDLGGSSTLTWQTKNTSSVTFDTGGASPIIPNGQAVSGAYQYIPQAGTTNIAFTATGPSGTVRSNTVTIRINGPQIFAHAYPEIIGPGETSTLAWTTKNATSITIPQLAGRVLSLNGTTTVNPTQTTTYTFTVTGPSGTISTPVTVSVVSQSDSSIFSGSFVGPSIQINRQSPLNIKSDTRIQQGPPPGFTNIIPPQTQEGN